MRRFLGTLGLIGALALTGCGGGSDDKDKAAPTTLPPPTTAAVGNDQANTPFCGLARTLEPKLTAVVANLSDKVKLKAAATDAESTISQATSTAPAEIKADVTTVASTATSVLAALRKNDFDVSKTPEFSKLQEPAFANSFANVNRYTRAHCGVG
jgi:hypothetical protein